ncbi:protein of unknown function [Pseudomonas sp. JV241A]|nr:protein of unknown function [Pseudomonas sp. JV241A]
MLRERVGAGLPAMVVQATPDVPAELASSLASQLPQCICVRRTCRSGLAPRSSAQRSRSIQC